MEILADRPALVKRSRNLFIASAVLLTLSCIANLVLLSSYVRSGLSNQFSSRSDLVLTWLFFGAAAMIFTGIEIVALRKDVYSNGEASRMRSGLPKWYTFLSFGGESVTLYAIAHSTQWAKIVTAVLYVYMLGILVLEIADPALRTGPFTFVVFSAVYVNVFWTFALFSWFTLHYLTGDAQR